jgi:hypothetical protein
VNTFIPTLELLGKVKTLLAALETAPGTKLFEKVEYYSAADLVSALEELRIFKQRVCVIVPSANQYESEMSGTENHLKCWREFVLIFSDRDYGRRQDASTGDAERVGVVAMNDFIEENLAGQNLGYKPRLLNMHPLDGEAVALTKAQKEILSGRSVWSMTWRACAGRKIVREK